MVSGDGTDDETAQQTGGLRAKLVPNFLRRRYGLKLFLLLLVVFVVAAGVGGYSYVQADRTVSAQTEDAVKGTATVHADAIDEWTIERRTSTAAISDAPILRDENATTEEIREYAKAQKSRYNSGPTGGRAVVNDIHVVDLNDGSLVTSTSTALSGESAETPEGSWTELRPGDFQSSENVWGSKKAYVPTAGNEYVLAFASPVPGNEDLAVVVVGNFGDFVSDLRSGADQSTVVLDRNGNSVVGEEVSVSEESFQSAVSGQPTFSDRGDTVQGYAPVTRVDWVVVTSQPASTAFAVRDEVGMNVGALVAAVLVTLTVVGVVIVRQTVRPLRHLQDKAAAMEDGDLSVSLAHNRIDEFGRLYDGFDAMRNSLRQQIREAQEARSEAEAARSDAEAMTRHLEEKADEYAAVMQSCAQGDLTARMSAESESEAMAEIAAEFNAMVAEIEATTAEVKAFAGEVATASEEVTASSEEVRSASEQVTESIQEISDGATRQNESLQSVTAEMGQLSTTTEEIAASSNEVADIAERTARTGRAGRDAAQEAIEGMQEIKADSGDAVEAIEALEDEMSEIDDLIEFIGDIAKETNMLALNANIEASRGGAEGGDGGEGFAVVAQQVKDLAAEAKDAAEDIEGRLESIQDQTHRTAEEVQRTSDRVDEHTASVENAVSALEDIADYAQETNTGVQEISAATEQQAASTQQVVAMVDDAATISEETTAEAENVAAAAEEQTTALTEVSQSASDLATNASTLSDALDRFDTDATDADVDGANEFANDAAASAFEDAAVDGDELADEDEALAADDDPFAEEALDDPDTVDDDEPDAEP